MLPVEPLEVTSLPSGVSKMINEGVLGVVKDMSLGLNSHLFLMEEASEGWRCHRSLPSELVHQTNFV